MSRSLFEKRQTPGAEIRGGYAGQAGKGKPFGV